jgi:molybdenum cofactor cytidylyltransferase
LLAHFEGKALIHHAVAAVASSPVDDIVLVTAADGRKIIDAAGPGRWRSIINPRTADGLSSSIQVGLAAIDGDADGAVIVLADMPRLTSGVIAQLCGAFIAGGGIAVVFPQTSGGRQGNPVLWPRPLFAELMALTGDTGGKSVLARHTNRHHPVLCDDDAVLFDIDTVADIRRAQTKAP